MNNWEPVGFSIRTVLQVLSYVSRNLHEGEKIDQYMEQSRNVTQAISYDYYVTPHREYCTVCGTINYVNITEYKTRIKYLIVLKFLLQLSVKQKASQPQCFSQKKAISIKQYHCRFVFLPALPGMNIAFPDHVTSMSHHLYPEWLCRIFRNCIVKLTIHGIKTIWHETRLIFSKIIIKTFRNPIIIRAGIVNLSTSPCRAAVISAQLTKHQYPRQVFVNQQQYGISWKSTEWETKCCTAGRNDGQIHDDANIYSLFATVILLTRLKSV